MSIGFIRGFVSSVEMDSTGRKYVFENVKSEDVPVWTRLKSNTDNGREHHGCAIVDRKMFVVCGMRRLGGSILNFSTNHLYNTVDDSWTVAAYAPAAKTGMSCAPYSLNGEDYVFAYGGASGWVYEATNNTYQYSLSANTWTSLTNLSYSRIYASLASIGQYVYVFGGATTYNNPASAYAFRYDAISNAWTMLPSYSSLMQLQTATAVGKYIYIFGGASTYESTALDVAFRYDTELSTWSTITKMPAPRVMHAAAAIGSKIYVFGGVSGTYLSMTQTDTVYCYDTETGEWTLLPDRMPVVMYKISAESFDNGIYIYGGKIDTLDNSNTSSSQTLLFKMKSEPSIEIIGENKLLFDKDVLVGDTIIPANTETTVTVESAIVTFPEMTSGTIEPIGHILIN